MSTNLAPNPFMHGIQWKPVALTLKMCGSISLPDVAEGPCHMWQNSLPHVAEPLCHTLCHILPQQGTVMWQ